jgi:hypothetical protein
MISDNLALYSDRGAHRFIPWGDLVAMVVRSPGLRGAGEDQEKSAIPPMAADVCQVNF